MEKAFVDLARDARAALGAVMVGHEDALDVLFLTVVCGGHVLLEGVPGLGKTLAVRTLAQVLGIRYRRVQCTPDLMPADVTGSSVLNMATSEFRVHEGPVFTDVLLVDEINRMPPRTQAALLEAMEERQVTIDGRTHALPSWFTTFATQNPIEFEGTYPLPEAELDRFLVKIRVGYPDAASGEEEELLRRYHEGFDAREVDRMPIEPLPPEGLAGARREVLAVRVEPALSSYIAPLARR